MTVAGLLGAAAGSAPAALLVKVLTGVFDPPPAHLAAPGLYLAPVTASAVLAAGVAAELTIRASSRPVIQTLREL